MRAEGQRRPSRPQRPGIPAEYFQWRSGFPPGKAPAPSARPPAPKRLSASPALWRREPAPKRAFPPRPPCKGRSSRPSLPENGRPDRKARCPAADRRPQAKIHTGRYPDFPSGRSLRIPVRSLSCLCRKDGSRSHPPFSTPPRRKGRPCQSRRGFFVPAVPPQERRPVLPSLESSWAKAG